MVIMELFPKSDKFYGAPVTHPVLQDVIASFRISIPGYVSEANKILLIILIQDNSCSLHVDSFILCHIMGILYLPVKLFLSFLLEIPGYRLGYYRVRRFQCNLRKTRGHKLG